MSKKDNSIIITPSKKKGENRVTIKLNDELTIYTIEDINSKIKDSIKKYSDIEFDLTKVNNMDLTFMQLITSIKKSGKQVVVNVQLTPENRVLFENTDLVKILNN